MKIVKFCYKKNIHWGVVKDAEILVLRAAPFKKMQTGSKIIPLDKCKLLPPADPTKIILVGLNYKDHARELKMKVPKEPIIFLKPSSSLAAHKDSIVYPESVGRLDYEAELALVIKRKAKNIPKNKAKDYILGYTCLNDITARDLQTKDGQWTRAKSFDGFCPLGPWLETGIEPSSLRIASYLNGVLKQYSNTANFIFPVDYLVSFISRVMTLSPGDVISTGTPYGVGSMQRGDTIEVDIENIGRLKNHVR
jgi:2-keto-4-pentenoate hydratase/2-oxohepta-3-ene-1,7-dioic acid hydratase in catechol pathway